MTAPVSADTSASHFCTTERAPMPLAEVQSFRPASQWRGAKRAAHRRAAEVVCTALMAGCSAGAGTVHSGPSQAAFTQHYFEGLASSPLAACAPVANGDLVGQSLDVSLFFGADTSDDVVVAEGSRLQRFFDPYGLQFRATGAATATTLRYAMNGTAAQLNAALDPLGLPLDGQLTDEQWQQAGAAVGAVIFADLRGFVEAHVEERTVHLVVLEHVLAPELSEYLFGSDGPKIIGFTVSTTLFRRVDASDPEYSLWRMTGLSADFTPTSFIGDADVGYLPGSADNLVAHEIGHALGLSHASEADNLMTPGQNRLCDEALSSTQLGEMRQSLLFDDVSGDATPPVAVGPLFRVMPQIVRAAILARLR